ncbi:hypothetical protein ABZP36_026791 [Zizania latifolia]
MDFFKIKKFGKTRKNAGGEGEIVESEDDANAGNVASDEQKGKILEDNPAAAVAAGMDADAGNGGVEGDDDDDDDFITNEVKRRLKELRKNSFMVLIPEAEEECAEVEEDGEEEEGSSSREWTEDVGTLNISKKSPRSASKLASTLRNLSFKRRDDLQEDCEHLQQQQREDDPYQTLETAYVGQVSLSWEALHCMYVHLSVILAAQLDNPTSYSCAAQAFQQFQVLLQRFVENEPFEQGSRIEIYARSRSSLSKLLQVPTFQVADSKYNVEDQVEPSIFAPDLIKLLEESILTFRLFLKKDKKKNSSLMSVHSHTGSSIQQVQLSLDKKEVKVKELFKRKKGWNSKTWPATMEEVQLLFALIDIKVVSRVLRMAKLSKEQLLWCEEKMSKLDLSDNKLRRDGSPILFPC